MAKSKMAGIFQLRCPHCLNADLFETGSFSFSRPFDMKPQCDYCGQDFMPEPGFYYGAMFISYIFTGFFCIGFVGILHWGFKWSINASFGLLIAVCAIFFVYVFRLSRSIWLSVNVKYDPQAGGKVGEQ